MRGLWWVLKLFAGLVLVGCVLSVAPAVMFPEFTRHAGTWLGALLLSGGVYRVADARLGRPERPPAAPRWQAEQYVLAPRLLRQGALCLVLAGLSLGVPLALLHGGQLPGWQQALVLLGALLGLWLCRSAVIGLLHMRRAGFALKLDAAGVHFPGLPLLPWTHVTALALEPPRPDSDRSQCLVLRMRRLPEQPSGLRALWRAALPGASITGHSVSLPLPTLRQPAVLLDAAHALWRRHGAPSTCPASPPDRARQPIR